MNCTFRTTVVTLVFTILMVASDVAPLFAQSDSQLLRVLIPESMTLEQLRPDRTSTHPQTSGDVLLGTSMWLAQSNRAAGVTVDLRTNTPFIHQTQASESRDVELRIPGTTGWGDWTVDVPIDQTNVSGGDSDAEVRSSSTGPGQCWRKCSGF